MGSLMALLVLTLYFVFSGGLQAAEDTILPMRGLGPEGKVQVNQIQFQAGGQWGSDILANSGKPEAVIKRADYVGWRDNCVRAPLMVAGQALDVDAPGGFVLAPPLIRKPETEGDGFYDALVREFTP